MNERKLCTIGVDFGSLSARAVVVDTDSGAILGEAAAEYPHGILSGNLPDGTPLEPDCFLQDPEDYTDVLARIVPQAMKAAGDVDIIGMAVDFTASTMVPVDGHFRPLRSDPAFAGRIHAWCKLWKHHADAPEARLLNEICAEQKRLYPGWYGGTISQECLLPKAIEVYHKDPEVFARTAAFVEAGDYVTSILAGTPCFSLSIAAGKNFWCKDGYPDGDFYAAIAPKLRNLPKEKFMDRYPEAKRGYPGTCVGRLCPEWAEKLGLPAGIALSAPQMDAYAALPAVGAQVGTALLVVGTSTGILVPGEKRVDVKGVTACLPDTFYPGAWGYASGQCSVGDTFQWFVDNCVPEEERKKAQAAGKNLHSYLTDEAAKLAPGETGLLALDWFNGNRSPLADPRLSGLILGLNLQTKPAHIYRALLEATAFGARHILEVHERAGLPIERIILCGGIPGKNTFFDQLYADVLGRPVEVSTCTQAPALGSAILAAVAAGRWTLQEAIEKMQCADTRNYTPDPSRPYEFLYEAYITMTNTCFGPLKPILDGLYVRRRK